MQYFATYEGMVSVICQRGTVKVIGTVIGMVVLSVKPENVLNGFHQMQVAAQHHNVIKMMIAPRTHIV